MNGVNALAAYTNAKLRISQNNYDYKDEVIVLLWDEARAKDAQVLKLKGQLKEQWEACEHRVASSQFQVQILESRDWYATEHAVHQDEAGQVLAFVMESSLPASLTEMSTSPEPKPDLTHTSKESND